MRILAAEKDPRLPRDLREHRRADMSLDTRALNELAELVDPSSLLVDPFLYSRINIFAAAAREELDPQLLEVAGKPGGQQAFPLIGGDETRDLLLRPVEAERLAQPR